MTHGKKSPINFFLPSFDSSFDILLHNTMKIFEMIYMGTPRKLGTANVQGQYHILCYTALMRAVVRLTVHVAVED